MQYLFSRNFVFSVLQVLLCLLPDSMNPFLEERSPCTFCNKVLHLLEFFYAASFESPRVVKDEVLVASEDHLVFDVVESPLGTCQLNVP